MSTNDRFAHFPSGPSMPAPLPGDHHRPTPPDPSTPPAHPEKPPHPVHPEKPEPLISIIVNGVDKVLPAGTKQLSYEDVVRLAYDEYASSNNVIYTVVYSNGPIENKKGTLVKGDAVMVRRGMIFNVGRSTKS